MPDITVKSFAELIHTPLYGQMRILREQKYPKQTPGIFKIQYYKPAISLIRRFYSTGNDPSVFPQDSYGLTGIGNIEHQRTNNFRAITSFLRGNHTDRSLTLSKPQTWEISLSNVTIRSTPDLYYTENGNEGHIIIDCREQSPETEIIRTTLEIYHHTLGLNNIQIPMRKLEYIHLESDRSFYWNNVRKKTINRATQTAQAIGTLWNSI